MATLNLTAVPIAGGASITDNLVAAAAGGDSAAVGEGRFLVVKNGDASSHTVTISTPGTVAGVAIAEVAVTVAASKLSVIPLSSRVFKDATGRAAITYDAVTSVTVGVFELGRA
jgi:hypothetical protein